jgi:ATP-dependent DNA helicase RecG
MVYATIRQHGDAVGQLNGELNGQLNGQLNGTLSGTLSGTLNSAQKATLNYIKENAGCNATEISDKTGVPFSTIDKHIRVLLKNGKIERRGSKKTGGYYIK